MRTGISGVTGRDRIRNGYIRESERASRENAGVNIEMVWTSGEERAR